MIFWLVGFVAGVDDVQDLIVKILQDSESSDIAPVGKGRVGSFSTALHGLKSGFPTWPLLVWVVVGPHCSFSW